VSEITLKEVEVQKLNLQPGDFLVVTVKSDRVSPEFLDHLQKEIQDRLGNNTGVVLGHRLEEAIEFKSVKQSKTVPVKIKKLHKDAVIPQYQTFGASGFDLHALEDITILPDHTLLVRTGLSFEVPKGYELQIRPRSGLSLKTHLRVANAPGTVDSDYRGEVCVIMTNTMEALDKDYTPDEDDRDIPKIKKGDRIAQGVICPVVQAEFEVVEELENTSRGSGAFGSTGQ
jgi:dUTP pyrophosphatase